MLTKNNDGTGTVIDTDLVEGFSRNEYRFSDLDNSLSDIADKFLNYANINKYNLKNYKFKIIHNSIFVAYTDNWMDDSFSYEGNKGWQRDEREY